MVHKINSLPPRWTELAKRQVFRQAARCSPGMVDAANQIFLLNIDELTEKVVNRSVPG